MRENWTYKKLGEVCDFVSGFTPKSEQLRSNGKYPYFKVADMNTLGNEKELRKTASYLDHSLKYYKKNTIVFPKNGAAIATNKKRILAFDSIIDLNTAGVYTDGSLLSYQFLYYFLLKIDFKEITRGGAVPTLDLKELKNKKIILPPLSEQQSIVAELDKINELISLKKAQLSDLDALAQSIFYDMFGDIDDDTPLSHFISSLGGGKSLAGKDPCINKVLKTGAVTFDYFDGNSVKDLPLDYVPLQEHLLKDGDLLVSRMNTPELVGSCAYVWKAPDNTYLPDRLWRATLKQGNNPIYLWFSIIQLKSKEQIRSLASGTSGSMKNISKPRFLSVKIKKAPIALQQDFAKRIELIEQQKAQISSTIKDLETLLASRMQYWFD